MASLEIGSVFAGYRIDAVVGRGAMGIVYRAWEEGLGRAVALKVIAEHIAAEPEFRDRFQSESRLAATVEHPGIVAIYAAGEADGVPYLAMRFVDGESLSEVLARRGRLEPREAQDILMPIARALDAAGRKGVLHRDVKLANILIPADDSGAVLIDFGIGRARDSTHATQTGGWLGTVDYLAPERIHGDTVDERSDQYSLACALYELVTGEPPFRRDEPIKTLFAHANDPVPPASTSDSAVDDAVTQVLARGLAKDPAARFASCEELLLAFGSALSGKPAVTNPVPPPAGTRKRSGVAAAEVVTGPTGTVIDGGRPPTNHGPTPDAPPSPRVSRPLIAVGAVAVVLLIALIVVATRGGNDSPSQAEQQPVAAPATTSSMTPTQAESSGESVPEIQASASQVVRMNLTDLVELPLPPYRCITPDNKDHGGTISFVAGFANGAQQEFRSDRGTNNFILCGGSTSKQRPGYASGTLAFMDPYAITRVRSVSGVFGRDYDAGVNQGGVVRLVVGYDGTAICEFSTDGAGHARRFVCSDFPDVSSLSGVTLSLDVQYDAQYSEFAGIANATAKVETFN